MIAAPLNRILESNRIELATLEGNLLSAAKGGELSTIFVTSCRPGEGKTTSAVLLAYGLATTAGRKVILADACLSRPSLHQVFGLAEDAPGLTNLIGGSADCNKLLYETGIENLSVMPVGNRAGGGGRGTVLPFDACNRELANLKDKADFIVCDGDSVFTSSNAAVMARCFDGVVLAVESGRTKWEVVRLAHEKIHDVGGRIIGVVLNKRKYHIPSGLYEKI